MLENLWQEILTVILEDVCAAIRPDQLVYKAITEDEDGFRLGDLHVDFSAYRTVNVLAVGKAARRMADALQNTLDDRIDAGVIVSKTPFTADEFPAKYTCLTGAHPVPDQSSIIAGETVLDFVSTLNEKDLLITLISGGGSALMCAPVEGMTLADLQHLNRDLLASGATINEINQARKRVDRVKGGGVARAANGARIVNLILSDVIGNDLATIASGPTILATEEMRPGQIDSLIIGDVRHAMDAVAQAAARFGFETVILPEPIHGEASQVGAGFAARLREERVKRPVGSRPLLLIRGGESTVTLHPDPTQNGLGGRNLETALGAVNGLDGLENVALVTFATDGEDGPTDAAGAIVTGETAAQARMMGIDPNEILARHDAYRFFAALDGLIQTGSTGSNVNDLLMGFIF